MALGFARINHVWSNPAYGTAPFVTGLWFVAPDGATFEEFEDVMDVVGSAWDAGWDTQIHSAIGAGKLVGQYIEGTTVYDKEQAISNATGSSGIFGVGYSFRVVFSGARPAGGRPNQMYWPYPEKNLYDATGAVAGSVQTAVDNWAEDILDGTLTGAFSWANRHFVDSDTHDPSWSNVTGATVSPTISWLQKRYR